ncbi:MAG: FAD-dependent oxidoreductase [Candidatus Sumerlaeia bacterium]
MTKATRIVIIGGVAGGASAAARARRLSEDAEIIMFERGEHISFANCGLPYHIGGQIQDRDRLLVQTAAGMEKRYGIQVHTRTEVQSINREKKSVTVKDLESGETREVYYDKLIMSPGAEPVRLPIPGVDDDRVMTLRNLTDMDAIIERLEKGAVDRAVIIGGGYIGLEMAEALRDRNVNVVLVELAEQVFLAADPEMVSPVHQQLALHGVDLRLGTSVKSFQDRDGKLDAELSTGESVLCGMAIMAVGVRPEVKLAKDAGIEIGKRGGILVDKHMRTNDPDIYAVGDAVEVEHFVGGGKALIPLAGPANRQGRIASDNIFGRDSEYKDTQGTAICKVFDLAIGMTGKNELQLKDAGVEFEKVYVHPSSHAGYYPGATQMSLKLMFCPKTGKIYGAQAVGANGVDKRIDVLATALRAGLTVMDLEELELCYAPPYGSAKDPINYLGFVASNVVRGDMRLCHTEDVVSPKPDQFLLDVRTHEEVAAGTIPGATNIPVDDLRNRLSEIPKDKEVLSFCQVGLRGYLATRILDQNGFKTRNLTGGYKTYKAASAPKTEETSVTEEMKDDTGVGPAADSDNGKKKA